jgi:DNA-directed RNA polymerase subunit H (RpoH/RPB5)
MSPDTQMIGHTGFLTIARRTDQPKIKKSDPAIREEEADISDGIESVTVS